MTSATVTRRKFLAGSATSALTAGAVLATPSHLWGKPLPASPGQAASGGPPGVANGDFEVQKIAEGVFAAIRSEPPGFAVDANVVFIINDEDVIVIDTNVAPSSAKELLAALRKLTSKPVKYVVNTHWHDDHISGNQIYRDAFPAVDFIGHAETRDYLPTTGAANRTKQLAGSADFVKMLQSNLENNKNFAGTALSEEERASYKSDIKIAARYVGEAGKVEVILPTLTVQEGLTLYRGGRAIEIRQLGRGHTAGDIVVHLPQERIVVTGDLVVWPVPLIGSDQSHITDWIITLEKMRALAPRVIVPGHGPVMYDDSYLQLLGGLLASIKQQTDAAVARGETLEQAGKSVNLDEFRGTFAGNSSVRRALFSNYAAYPGIAAAYRETSKRPGAKP